MLETLSREFREGSPMEFLYADDLILMAESEELLLEKLRKWKKGMEAKGLRVNAGKTKVMQCQVSRVSRVQNTGKHPCGVCRKAVAILCVECLLPLHLHKRCSGISMELKSNVDFRCRICLEESPVESLLQREVEIEPNVKLECVPKFCHLGDTLGAGGGTKG